MSINLKDIGRLTKKKVYNRFDQGKLANFRALDNYQLMIQFPKLSEEYMQLTDVNYYSIQDILTDFGGLYKSATLIIGLTVVQFFIWQMKRQLKFDDRLQFRNMYEAIGKIEE